MILPLLYSSFTPKLDRAPSQLKLSRTKGTDNRAKSGCGSLGSRGFSYTFKARLSPKDWDPLKEAQIMWICDPLSRPLFPRPAAHRRPAMWHWRLAGHNQGSFVRIRTGASLRLGSLTLGHGQEKGCVSWPNGALDSEISPFLSSQRLICQIAIKESGNKHLVPFQL